MSKILITTSSFNVSLLSELTQNAATKIEVVLNPYKRKLTEDEVKELLTDDVIGMIAGVEPLTENVLASAKNLKIISRCGVGMDSVNLDAAKKLGIRVTNTPDAPTLPVAELTMAHILNLLRNVSQVDSAIRNAVWEPKMGSLLNGKTVGIIGFGRIGKKVASLVEAFGANILVYDIFPVSGTDNIKQVELNYLFSNADIITLHMPYTDKDHHFVSAEKLGLMKPSALLLNISRGGLVDEDALVQALADNKIAGAGIDAFEKEPYSGPLTKFPNVLLTAHMGSYAKEARYKMEQEAVDNLFSNLKEMKLLY